MQRIDNAQCGKMPTAQTAFPIDKNVLNHEMQLRLVMGGVTYDFI